MTVRLIATGGTIASLADPETGAVRPAVSAQDLVTEAYQELIQRKELQPEYERVSAVAQRWGY